MKKQETVAMQYSVFTDADWLFPDFPHGQQEAIYLLPPGAAVFTGGKPSGFGLGRHQGGRALAVRRAYRSLAGLG